MVQKDFKKIPEVSREGLLIPEVKISEKKIEIEPKKELLEKDKERREKRVITPEKPITKPSVPPKIVADQTPVVVKTQILIEIESILAEDLEDVYFKMDSVLQQKFKNEGEKTAVKIEQQLQQTKMRVNKIFKLILEWLKIIPGINKYFIKQEAKIKTDKIIKLKQKQ